jgi:hypothetical protein
LSAAEPVEMKSSKPSKAMKWDFMLRPSCGREFTEVNLLSVTVSYPLD